MVAHHHSNEAVTPRKDSNEKKIDGVLALLMALDRAVRAMPEIDSPTPGLWII